MTGEYCRGRLILFDALIKKGVEVSKGQPWMIDAAELRFKLGGSAADIKIPYHMGSDDDGIIEDAVKSFITLLVRRFDPDKADAAKEILRMQSAATPAGALMDKTRRTDIFITGSIEKTIAEEITRSAPNIDCGVIANWLGPLGHGRKFLKWFADLIEKTLKEEARAECSERTSYLALLAVISTVRKKKEQVKGLRIHGLAYEKADLLSGISFFVSMRHSLEGMFKRLKASRSSSYSPSAEALLTSALTPGTFMLIQSTLLSSSLNPYGISRETFDQLDSSVPNFNALPGGIDDKIKAAGLIINDDEETLSAVKAQHDAERLRDGIYKYLAEMDLPGVEGTSELCEIYYEDRLLRNYMNDPKLRDRLHNLAEDARHAFGRDPRKIAAIDAFLNCLSSFKKPGIGRLLRKRSTDDASFTLPIIEAFFACKFDDNAERFADAMRSSVIDKRGEFNAATMMEEYSRGRLYRFAADERPVLKTFAIEEEGQLFVDMKNFTNKTLKIKEAAMADFMRENFYKPILGAADRYAGTPNEDGIRLTNLLGDAAIFSGGVSGLISLAADIQKIILGYRQKLLKRLPPGLSEKIIGDVHAAYEAKTAELKQKNIDAARAVTEKTPGAEAIVSALVEEERRLENTYRYELEEAIKGELEAGLFISYGAKAETIIIESAERSTRGAEVAIGEKINEAARGTNRNAHVRARMEVMLESEKCRRGAEKLECPFNVRIDRICSMGMPYELDGALERVLSIKKVADAQTLARAMSEKFYNDLKKIVAGKPISSLDIISITTDIYNKGQAISGAALDAYMRENKGVKRFFAKTIPVSELDEALREHLFYPSEHLEFKFSYEMIKSTEVIEAFCKSGEIVFKGFETNKPIAVWEMLDVNGELFNGIVAHHFRSWLVEAENESTEE